MAINRSKFLPQFEQQRMIRWYENSDYEDNGDDEIISVFKYCAVADLSDYRPIPWTPVVMQCFNWQVMTHIEDSVVTVALYQYANR